MERGNFGDLELAKQDFLYLKYIGLLNGEQIPPTPNGSLMSFLGRITNFYDENKVLEVQGVHLYFSEENGWHLPSRKIGLDLANLRLATLGESLQEVYPPSSPYHLHRYILKPSGIGQVIVYPVIIPTLEDLIALIPLVEDQCDHHESLLKLKDELKKFHFV